MLLSTVESIDVGIFTEGYDMSITHGNVDTPTTQKKITASSYQQDVTLMLNGMTCRQPDGKFVSEVNIAHGWPNRSFDNFLDNIVPILTIFSPQTMIL